MQEKIRFLYDNSSKTILSYISNKNRIVKKKYFFPSFDEWFASAFRVFSVSVIPCIKILSLESITQQNNIKCVGWEFSKVTSTPAIQQPAAFNA